MEKEQVLHILKQINWDTPYTPEQLYQVFTGAVESIGGVDKKWIYRKLLNGYNWYKVIEVVPRNEWKALLEEDIINSLFPRVRRPKYQNVRRILFGETLPASGQGIAGSPRP